MTSQEYTVKVTIHWKAETAEANKQAQSTIIDALPAAKPAGDHSVTLEIPWEPPLKELREISKQCGATEFTMIGDAFVDQHWITRATAVNGKLEDETLTRVDGDAFDKLFLEVYGLPYSDWEKTQPRI